MEENNDDLYTNLLKATDNLQDIVFQRYATVTSESNGKYTLKELDSELIHNNVPSITTDIKKGDTVLLAFTDNSLHNPIILGQTKPTPPVLPCDFEVVDTDLVFDFCGEGGGEPSPGGGVDIDTVKRLINSAINELDIGLSVDLMSNGYMKLEADLIKE